MTGAAVATLAGQRMESRALIWFLGLTLATSSIVFIEPAPYDFLVVILLVTSLATGLRFPREVGLALLLLSCFVLGNLIAAIASADPATTIRSLSIRIYMVLAWCLFVSAIAANPVRVLRTIWLGYMVAAVIAAAWAMLEYFDIISFGIEQPGFRAKGSFKDANVYAPFLIPVAIYALSRVANDEGGLRKLMYAALYLIMAFGVLLSFSRGAWLNFVISSATGSILILVGLSGYRARLRWLLLNVILIFAAFMLLGGSATQSNVAERLAQRAVLTQKYDVARGGRFYTQKQAITRIGTTPQGIGPGRSDEEFGLEPHNLFLHVFVEGGWLAGVAFLSFIALGFYRSLELFRWDDALRDDFFVVFASAIGVITQSLFIDSTH
jgi:O-antigen ligase